MLGLILVFVLNLKLCLALDVTHDLSLCLEHGLVLGSVLDLVLGFLTGFGAWLEAELGRCWFGNLTWHVSWYRD